MLFVLAWYISLLTSPLAGRLEKVGTDALHGYSNNLVNIMMQGTRSILLTGNVGRGLEGAKNVRVHGDAEVALLHQPAVSLLDVLEYPVSKRLADDGVDHVDDPLTRKTTKLIILRQVLQRLRVLGRLREELLDAEALVLWHRQVLSRVSVEELLVPCYQGLEEVDGHSVVWGQERVTVDRHEVITRNSIAGQLKYCRYLHFSLGAVLGREHGCRHLLNATIVNDALHDFISINVTVNFIADLNLLLLRRYILLMKLV